MSRAPSLMILVATLLSAGRLAAQESVPGAPGDSVTVRLVDTDLRAVVQTVARYLPKPVVSANIPSVRVTLETPVPVTRSALAVLLGGLLGAHGLEFVEDSAFYRVGLRSAEVASGPPQPAQQTSHAQPVRLHVIRLKHARAADVAATVNLLFGGGGTFSGGAGLSGGTLSDELRRQNVPPQGGEVAPAPQAEAKSATFGGDVTIVPDGLTNSILVRASESDFAVLREAVDQLDIRPLQVLIEVLIVEARKDRHFSLGADLFLPLQGIGGDQTIEGSLLGGGLGDLVIKLMNLGKANIDAVIRTAESKGDVQIVSRPVLLASNNTEARFLVGSQRPFVQVSRSLPTDTPTRDQVVQYRDVGTKLTVRPTINQDGYVSLELQQEINAATNETQFDAPVISTREAATQVLVRDGQTIVLGGLQDRQRDYTRSGVPVLSSLPLLGGLFGSSDKRSTATELFLFLTPRIIRTDADADSVTVPRLPEIVQ
jgi:general secretion pathway protein D